MDIRCAGSAWWAGEAWFCKPDFSIGRQGILAGPTMTCRSPDQRAAPPPVRHRRRAMASPSARRMRGGAVRQTVTETDAGSIPAARFAVSCQALL